MNKAFELLVVEDDVADIDLIKEALEISHDQSFEIHLTCVGDGDEAMDYLRKKNSFQNVPRPNLVMLDLNMPRKGGLEVLQEIKSDVKLKNIPVVILSTSNSFDDVQKSYALGANSFITKAKDFTEFARLVHTLVAYWFKVSTLPSP